MKLQRQQVYEDDNHDVSWLVVNKLTAPIFRGGDVHRAGDFSPLEMIDENHPNLRKVCQEGCSLAQVASHLEGTSGNHL